MIIDQLAGAHEASKQCRGYDFSIEKGALFILGANNYEIPFRPTQR